MNSADRALQHLMLGNPVQCGRCGSRSWTVNRMDRYEAVGTVAEGADALIVCRSCGTVARSDGKVADPEGRLTP